MKAPHTNTFNSIPGCEPRFEGGWGGRGVGRDLCRGPRVRPQAGSLGLQLKVTGGVAYLQACLSPACPLSVGEPTVPLLFDTVALGGRCSRETS